MRSVTLVACLISIVLLPVNSSGQVPPADHDVIGVYLSPGSFTYCTSADFLEHVIFWLVLYNPTRPVYAVDCRIRMEPEPVGNGVWVGTWDVDGAWVNDADTPSFSCRSFQGPATGTHIAVARIDILVLDDSEMIEVYIDPPEGSDEVRYLTLYGQSVELTRRSGLYPAWPDAWINGPYWFCHFYPPNETFSWSAVKTLYRK